jgi:hypothetical protein
MADRVAVEVHMILQVTMEEWVTHLLLVHLKVIQVEQVELHNLIEELEVEELEQQEQMERVLQVDLEE